MKFLISPNFIRENTKDILNTVTAYLEGKAEYRLDDYTKGPESLNGFVPDIVFFIGGDGTFLKSANRALYFNAPVIGVKNGGVAYLCEIEESSIISSLERLLQGEYRLLECPCIDISINGETYTAVSEIALGKISVLSYFDVSSEDSFVYSTRASGLVLSTGIGSTGLNKSAGGFEIKPEEENLEITPICCYSGEKNSKLISVNKEYDIKVSKDTDFAVDGQLMGTISTTDTITIKATRKLKVIKF